MRGGSTSLHAAFEIESAYESCCDHNAASRFRSLKVGVKPRSATIREVDFFTEGLYSNRYDMASGIRQLDSSA